MLPGNIPRHREFRSLKSWHIFWPPKAVRVVIWCPSLVVHCLWPISLVVCHVRLERAVYWNLKVVGTKAVTLCVTI